MTTAFQTDSFENDAFQIDAAGVDPNASFVPAGPWVQVPQAVPDLRWIECLQAATCVVPQPVVVAVAPAPVVAWTRNTGKKAKRARQHITLSNGIRIYGDPDKAWKAAIRSQIDGPIVDIEPVDVAPEAETSEPARRLPRDNKQSASTYLPDIGHLARPFPAEPSQTEAQDEADDEEAILAWLLAA